MSFRLCAGHDGSQTNNNMHIGIAGWSIPTAQAHLATGDGSHLQRYSRTLNAVELNRTFYALPRAATVRKWVDCDLPG
jgi:uncharacterized protein YecE (DUF72 family)